MSFFAGGSSKKVKPDYTGIQLQTSSSVQALTIQLGTNRVGPNLLWYADFKAHKVKQKAGKGGGGQSTSYTYTASCILGLCEGDATLTVGQVFVDSSTPVSYQSLGMSLFVGTNPQPTWGYLTSKHPDQARDYAGVAFMAVANYDLGSSASLPNHSFEVFGIGNKSAANGSNDADPALCVDRFLTASAYGVGMSRDVIDLTTLYSVNGMTTGDAAFQTYCAAKGWGISPTLSDQDSASDTLALWMQALNTAICWTGYSLKFIPYDLSNIDGNGYHYRPITTPIYTLTDDDYVSNKDDPVKFDRTDPADAYNQLTTTINDKTNQYNQAPADWRDQGLIDQYGLIPGSALNGDFITDMAMGVECTKLAGQRMAYVNNTGTFVLGQAHILIEPMDLLIIQDPNLGDLLVQVDSVEEDDDYNLTITADQISIAVSSNNASQLPISVISNVVNQAAPPGPVNPVLLFDVPSNLSGGTAQVWAAVSGGDGTTANMYWGGANVYVSTDNVTYNQIGVTDNPARQGKTTNDLPAFTGANPEATTFNVNLAESEGELTSVSASDAATFTTISKIGDEFIAYQTATLTALNEYDLTTIYRGLYQSTPVDHPTGTAFTRLDDAIFKYDLPADLIGIPLWFKFQSFNIWGNTPEDLSDCVAYPYTPTGLGFQVAPPTNLGLSFVSRTQADGTSIIRGTVTLTPSAGPYLDHQDVQITSDAGVTWSDIPAIPQGSTTTYFEPTLAATDYQARSRAVSSAVGGIPSDWVETAVITSGVLGGTAPAAPTGLMATGLTLSNGLSWVPGTGAGGTPQGFYIYAQHVATGGVFSSATRVGSADIDLFNHTGLGSDDSWTYWVTAYNAAGESDPVGPEEATTETSGGGGGGSIEVDQNGTSIVAAATKLNFTGSAVTITDAGGGVADIAITGSGGGGGGSGIVVTAVGTGVSQDVPLGKTGLIVSDVMVFVNGLKWETTEYTITGSDLTLTTNAVDDLIEIIGFPASSAGGLPFWGWAGSISDNPGEATATQVNANGDPQFSMLNDNIHNFYFASGATDQVLTYDFAKPVMISGIAFHINAQNLDQGTWQAAWSDDNVTWTDIGAPRDMKTDTRALWAWNAFANSTPHRYWRMYQAPGSIGGNSGPYVDQFQFRFGASATPL